MLPVQNSAIILKLSTHYKHKCSNTVLWIQNTMCLCFSLVFSKTSEQEPASTVSRTSVSEERGSVETVSPCFLSSPA